MFCSAKPSIFIAGADIKEMLAEDITPDDIRQAVRNGQQVFNRIAALKVPTVAAIHGAAMGGGCELALACDIRLASMNASMGLTETRLAIIPGAGGTQRLPRLVGRGKAKELIFTGQRIGAQEALNIGLVNKICEPNDLMAECQQMAGMICETGPIAIEQAKYAINYGIDADIHTGLAIESNAYWVTIPTEDRLEGLAAFKEKRKPVYKGK